MCSDRMTGTKASADYGSTSRHMCADRTVGRAKPVPWLHKHRMEEMPEQYTYSEVTVLLCMCRYQSLGEHTDIVVSLE